MAENKFKEHFEGIPVEHHDTAAWDNYEAMKPVSNVILPGEMDVRNAKEYVDTNQK